MRTSAEQLSRILWWMETHRPFCYWGGGWKIYGWRETVDDNSCCVCGKWRRQKNLPREHNGTRVCSSTKCLKDFDDWRDEQFRKRFYG